MKLTKERIEELAAKIREFLDEYELDEGVIIMYNNKMDHKEHGAWETYEDVDPHQYCEYHAYDHILSMNFDGACYEMFNGYGEWDCKLLDRFYALISSYGVYYERGYSYTCTFYAREGVEVEYTHYERPREKIRLCRFSDTSDLRLAEIMNFWYSQAKAYGNIGSCVIGAGFQFTLDNIDYWMSAQSPYQGSCSWECCLDQVKDKLRAIGATNILYNCGNLN